ncbi:MAG: 50S ribosomal protein L6 [Candidatus Dadabacteria bacterium]|nr:MAG: 50S ribosomal protein L6 [Candidatus Dadabacteria bacterium]
MSRVGKLPVTLPEGVKAEVNGSMVKIEGPKGKMEHTIPAGVKASVKDGTLCVEIDSNSKQARANWGTVRSLLNNSVIGVKDGWKKRLELHGVGYGAKLNGNELVLTVGLAHDVKFTVPDGIKCSVQKSAIDLESVDKQLVGNFAARVRKARPPEPYLGKGIRIAGEHVRRKAGKAGK